MDVRFNSEKFRELVLYIAEKSEDDPNFGATKLNKLLAFCDFLAYGSLGQPLTGATYEKAEHGPVPRELGAIQQDLVRQQVAAVQMRERFGYPQKRLIALRRPNLARFTGEEIALVDQIIDELWDHSATKASALSHSALVGWQLAAWGDDIPYTSIFLSPDPPTPADIQRGQELADQHGWAVGL
jgi:hypothetical protein